MRDSFVCGFRLGLTKLASGIPSMSTIPNAIAKRNRFPTLPEFKKVTLNANHALGPSGGGINGGGTLPGSIGYGISTTKSK